MSQPASMSAILYCWTLSPMHVLCNFPMMTVLKVLRHLCLCKRVWSWQMSICVLWFYDSGVVMSFLTLCWNFTGRLHSCLYLSYMKISSFTLLAVQLAQIPQAKQKDQISLTEVHRIPLRKCFLNTLNGPLHHYMFRVHNIPTVVV